ncbi:MAG: hypothetical protein C4313_09715 [Thermoflexus sp.]|uniref:sensor histidine kinase n=1 Tax=Thermoflexus sp. TaxID=1969742 RepID=UPI00331CA31D
MGHPHQTPDEWLARLEHQVLSALRELRGLYEQERSRREEAERLSRRLRDLDEMKTAFVARVSSELRQPLSLVIGFLEAALVQAPVEAEARKSIEAALRSAYRIVDYLAPLSAFAELQRHPLAFAEPVPLGALVQDLIRALEPRLAAGSFRVQAALDPEAAGTAVDGPYVSYILRMLLEFLLHLAREGDAIEIGGRVCEPILVVELVDRGLALPAEVLARWNEGISEDVSPPSGRLGPDPMAMGLGIAKRAAQTLGGDLFIRAEEAGGTVFSVLLPTRPLDVEDQIAILHRAIEALTAKGRKGA